MSIGVCIDCVCVLIGGFIGARFREKVPQRIKNPLNVTFGICAIAIGIVSFLKLNSLPAVILALIVGTLIGEILDLDTKIKGIFKKVIEHLKLPIHGDHEQYMAFYVIVAVTFCASGTNIFGAMNEGITGDMTVLISKAVMDVFAGLIFATTLGYAMNLIVIPQFIILTGCFFLARIIVPFISDTMFSDFLSVGGLMTFALGLSIADIKKINAANMLPSLLLAMPVSSLFNLIL